MFFLTCDECDYYSMEIKDIKEIKTMAYPKYDYGNDGVYHIEIGQMYRNKYRKLGNATVIIRNCKCVSADIHIVL